MANAIDVYAKVVLVLWVIFVIRFFYLLPKYEGYIRKSFPEKVDELTLFHWIAFKSMVNMHRKIDFGNIELRSFRNKVRNSFYHQLFFGIQAIIFMSW